MDKFEKFISVTKVAIALARLALLALAVYVLIHFMRAFQQAQP